MADQLNDEQYDIMPIPENCEYDLNIGNYTFEMLRAVEAVIFAAAFGGTLGGLAYLIHLKMTTVVVAVIMGVAGGGMLGIFGINGDDVFGYLINMAKFKHKKRVAIYNPRVKKELKFFVDENSETEDYVVPRERLEAMYRQLITQKDISSAEENLKEGKVDLDQIVFEDDIEYLGKPEELMSKHELKKYRKEKARQEREKEKEGAKRNEKKPRREKEGRKAVGIK